MMKQNRSMLLIVSLSLFLAIVVGGAAWLFYPRNNDSTVVEDLLNPDNAGTESVEWFLDDEELVPFTPEDAEPDELALEVPQAIPTVEVENDVVPVPARELGNGVTTDSSSRQDREERSDRESVETPTPNVADQAEPSRGTPTVARRSTPSSSVQSDGPSTARSSTTPSTRPVTEYWIQLISSPSRDTIDIAQERLLREYALGVRVTSRVIDETTFYRLRVGPYIEYDESVRFRDLIRRIDGFDEAYISEEYRVH